jgi:hypothetical protein
MRIVFEAGESGAVIFGRKIEVHAANLEPERRVRRPRLQRDCAG